MTRAALSTADLLERCRAWLHRFLVLSPPQEIVIAVWVLHTWAIDAADCTPYLHITAPEKGCGKTRLLEVLRFIVCRPWLTGRLTAASLVRKIAKDKPTLLLDESDAAFKGDVVYIEALRGILNSGFTRSGYSSLCVGKGTEMSIQDFPCFGPKAIAGIGDLPDTVASRSVVIAMRRKIASEGVERLRQRDVEIPAEALRAAMKAWAVPETIESLRVARPGLPEQMTDRQMDISEPLIAIADFAGGAWPEQLRTALLTLFGSVASEDSSIGVQLLRDIRGLFDERGGDTLFSDDIATALSQMEGQPWAEWANGRGFNTNHLARQLKKYGIAPRTVRIGGRTQKGYTRDRFEESWSYYCRPHLLTPVTSETAVTTLVNIENSQREMQSHSRHEGPFAAQRAGLPLPRFTRNVSADSNAKNERQSSIVTGVTAKTDMVQVDPDIAHLDWNEIGGGDAPSLPPTPITRHPATAISTEDGFIEVDL